MDDKCTHEYGWIEHHLPAPFWADKREIKICSRCLLIEQPATFIRGTTIPYTKWNLVWCAAFHPVRFWRMR